MQHIERYSALTRGPVERLKFLRHCATRQSPRRVEVLEALWKASPQAARALEAFDRLLLFGWRRRLLLRSAASRGAVCLLLLPLTGRALLERTRPPLPAPAAAPAPVSAPPGVWLVETSRDGELYSNGLRVHNNFLTRTGEREAAAGIVYHTTESEVAPLDPANRQLLRQRGRSLLEYVQRHQLYNFVIDRFGRVWRVVPEAEYAHHAGHSVWSDGERAYLNLNQSFLGVAFEARTSTDGTDVTPAQIHSAARLTEMLRAVWGIAASNCVSHDLVSVNPVRMLIGHHTDWAGRFPYAAVGLSSPYERPLPSIALFGFTYDSAFLEAVGGKPWPGIDLAEAALEREARRRGVSVARRRRELQQEFRRQAGRIRP